MRSKKMEHGCVDAWMHEHMQSCNHAIMQSCNLEFF